MPIHPGEEMLPCLAATEAGQDAGLSCRMWEAPGAEHFDSQKSNYRAADYRANKVPLCYFGK